RAPRGASPASRPRRGGHRRPASETIGSSRRGPPPRQRPEARALSVGAPETRRLPVRIPHSRWPSSVSRSTARVSPPPTRRRIRWRYARTLRCPFPGHVGSFYTSQDGLTRRCVTSRRYPSLDAPVDRARRSRVPVAERLRGGDLRGPRAGGRL